MSDNTPIQEDVNEPKQSNKSFEQSEVDKLVGNAIQREKSKYDDYDSNKDELAALKKEKLEKELADKTELEKTLYVVDDLTTKLADANGKLEGFDKWKVKNEILMDSKYNELPKVYKLSVMESMDRDAVIASADTVLTEFKKDFGKGKGEDFGTPTPENDAPAESRDDALQKIKNKVSRAIAQRRR